MARHPVATAGAPPPTGALRIGLSLCAVRGRPAPGTEPGPSDERPGRWNGAGLHLIARPDCSGHNDIFLERAGLPAMGRSRRGRSSARMLRGSPVSSLPIIHRDAVPERTVAVGDLAFRRRRIGAAAGAARIGCSLYTVDPGARQMPVHVHGDEEEIFFVLAGEGLSWQDGAACPIVAGDAIVHRPGAEAHTILAGEAGVELLAFASGSDSGLTWLPRAEVLWAGPRWVPVDAPHPFQAEAAAGPLPRPAAGARPGNVVALSDVAAQPRPGADVRALGSAAGSRAAGLNHVSLPPGAEGAPHHCHALEEELLLILEGSGTLRLGDDEHPVRAGDVVARPPSTGIAHSVRAGRRRVALPHLRHARARGQRVLPGARQGPAARAGDRARRGRPGSGPRRLTAGAGRPGCAASRSGTSRPRAGAQRPR